jgi:hypothetical protein
MNKQAENNIKENDMNSDKKTTKDYEDINDENYDYDNGDAMKQNDPKPKEKLFQYLEKILKEEK